MLRHKQAVEAGHTTYKGRHCFFCGSAELFIEDDKCVGCKEYARKAMSGMIMYAIDGRKKRKELESKAHYD